MKISSIFSSVPGLLTNQIDTPGKPLTVLGMMGGSWKAVIVGLALTTMAVQAWAGSPETFRQIDFKTDSQTALVTVASSINGDGFIVGWYCVQLPCNAASFRGFLRDPDGTFHEILVPTSDHPAIGTQARYISPQGIVIGVYLTLEDGATPGNPRFRGFACARSSCSGANARFTYFDAPEQDGYGNQVYDHSGPMVPHSIIPRAINANGDLVGCIHDIDQMGSMHGFHLHNGAFTRLTDGMTMNNGINAEGEIVGLDNSSTTAYRIDKSGNVDRLAFAGADFTNAWDISDRGEIVGQAFTNGGTVSHAFLCSNKPDCRFIDPVEALSATAFGISSKGDVVGQYRDSFTNCSITGCVHGFLLQRGD